MSEALDRLRAAAVERDWSVLQDTLAEALGEVEYFAGLEIGLTRAHDHLPIFEQAHPDASWARALLVWLASYGAPPADLPMDAGLAHDSPGANNYVTALVELARSAERKTPYENRIRFLANAIGNLIVADLAAYWYAENDDMWDFQQAHGSEIDEESGEPISQIVYASFWLDDEVAARDSAAWLGIADQLERKMKRDETMFGPLEILFIIALIVGFLIALNYLTSSRQERSNPLRPLAEIDWDAVQDDVVQTALSTGNKIEAIKRYRLLTGLGLKESKDAIDYAVLHPEERGQKKKKATYDAQDAGIRDLIQAGRLDEAVEIYQKFAGVDAYTARDAIDEIARDIHLSDQTASRTTFEVSPTDKSSRN